MGRNWGESNNLIFSKHFFLFLHVSTAQNGISAGSQLKGTCTDCIICIDTAVLMKRMAASLVDQIKVDGRREKITERSFIIGTFYHAYFFITFNVILPCNYFTTICFNMQYNACTDSFQPLHRCAQQYTYITN